MSLRPFWKYHLYHTISHFLIMQPVSSIFCVLVHLKAPSWLRKLPSSNHFKKKALVPLHYIFCPDHITKHVNVEHNMLLHYFRSFTWKRPWVFVKVKNTIQHILLLYRVCYRYTLTDSRSTGPCWTEKPLIPYDIIILSASGEINSFISIKGWFSFVFMPSPCWFVILSSYIVLDGGNQLVHDQVPSSLSPLDILQCH